MGEEEDEEGEVEKGEEKEIVDEKEDIEKEESQSNNNNQEETQDDNAEGKAQSNIDDNDIEIDNVNVKQEGKEEKEEKEEKEPESGKQTENEAEIGKTQTATKETEMEVETKEKKMTKKMVQKQRYLVKWNGLGYSESTWEYESDLKYFCDEFEEKVREFVIRKNPYRFDLEVEENAKKNLNNNNNDNNDNNKFSSSGTSNSDGGEKEEEKGKEYNPMSTDTVGLNVPSFKSGKLLREYQWEAVKWMLLNWISIDSKGCILADEMGLGKTVQTAAFLSCLNRYKSCKGPFLVIAPLSTLMNWYREMQGWTNLETVLYHGSSDDREIIREFEFWYSAEDYA